MNNPIYHITIRPDTYYVSEKFSDQNPYYGEKIRKVNHKLAMAQHKYVVNQLSKDFNYAVEKTKETIPDLVFIANGGMSLPRLPEPVIILPWMKYQQRRDELKYLKEMYADLNIRTIDFPGSHTAPYEGAAESKFFNNGELLVMGYGWRSTKESVNRMRALINDIYTSYGVEPPHIISFKLNSFNFYHLDIAMLEAAPDTCIVQKESIQAKDIVKLRKYILNVHVIDDADKFCLNAVVDGDNLITHILQKSTRKMFEELTGKNVIECDTSEFEKSGGSVRCMILDVYDPRLVKRKKHSPSAPSSPK
jgi:N-dimethylarginine dimethylaminohydrolase